MESEPRSAESPEPEDLEAGLQAVLGRGRRDDPDRSVRDRLESRTGARSRVHLRGRAPARPPPVEHNLGVIYGKRGKLEESLEHFRRAAESGHPAGWTALGTWLVGAGRWDDAIPALRQAIEKDGESRQLRYGLGVALANRSEPEAALVELDRALELSPDHTGARLERGRLLLRLGRLEESWTELRPAQDERARLPLPFQRDLARLLPMAERWADLARRIDAGENVPVTGPGDACDRGNFHLNRREYVSAARRFAEALEAAPDLAEDLTAGHRYNAACAAVRAGAGSGVEVLAVPEGAAWRARALAWPRADLSLRRGMVQRGEVVAGSPQAGALRWWTEDPDLAGVRGEEALARLPAEEREAWRALWAEVAELLGRLR